MKNGLERDETGPFGAVFEPGNREWLGAAISKVFQG